MHVLWNGLIEPINIIFYLTYFFSVMRRLKTMGDGEGALERDQRSYKEVIKLRVGWERGSYLKSWKGEQ